MSWKETAAIGFTVVGLAVGANEMLMPNSPEQTDQQRRQQQVEDLSDSQEKQNDKWRDDLGDGIDAEEQRKLQPGEHRPGQPPRIRIRLP